MKKYILQIAIFLFLAAGVVSAQIGGGITLWYLDDTTLKPVDPTWSVEVAGVGDVNSVGDCASGACLDGSSDGGTYVRIYDGNSHYLEINPGDISDNRTISFRDASGTVILSGDTFTGDVTGTLDTDGSTALTIAADSVALTTDTTGNYVESIADAGSSTITVVNGIAEGGAVTLDTVDLNCTNCINATEIEDIYLLIAGDDMAGQLDMANNALINAGDAGNDFGAMNSLVSTQFSGHIYMITNETDFFAPNNDDGDYMLFNARDSDTDSQVPVGGLTGAADPYFALGGTSEFKFYNSGDALVDLDKKIQFGDDGVYILSDDDGHLDLTADTSIDLNSTVALGANNLTMTGSISDTTNRVTKGWFADLEVTNDITIGGTALAATYSPIAGSASILTVGVLDSGSITSGFGTIATGDSISGSTLVATAADSLTLGTSSSADGSIILKNATNANTLTIQSGATSTSYTLTLPLEVAGAGEVLTDAAGNGVLSWTGVGAGDVVSVGDCSTGACFDGSSDGGTNLEFYNIDSNKTQLIASDTASDLIITLPATTGTLATTGVATLSSLTSIGTIATGTWEATDIGVTHGGTGVSTLTDHGVLVGSGDTDITALTVGTDGQILVGSDGADPVFATLNCDNALTCTTGAGTLEIDVDDAFIKLGGDIASAGTYDFGSANVVLEIPNAAAPTIDAAGEIAVDTTTDQYVYYGGAKRVMTYWREMCFTLETPAAADDDVPIWSPKDNITITDVYCRTQGGTSAEVIISDGTNALETVTCDADGQADDDSIANGTFTANERMEFDIGTVTGEVDWVNVCITYTIDAD